ncbi:hypothetical protein O2K51_00035 [Apibacter raozihei]|uniref:hypothetical protein n=1 Tax=Apibacter TaxID=1778601 RepID=UPI000FE35103|nr:MULTISPECIES: hypothetical protein [Apibacter]
MKKIFFLTLFFACVYFCNAQETIIKIDSATGGRLSISGEQDILKMIDDGQICKNLASMAHSSDSDSSNNSNAGTGTGKKTPTRPTTPKSVCGKRNDIPGFMIKVGEAKTEQDFNDLMSKFRNEFPELRVEKSYLRPDWRLLAGDYFKKESGQADLKRIRKSFPTAMLINWRIYCNRAK